MLYDSYGRCRNLIPIFVLSGMTLGISVFKLCFWTHYIFLQCGKHNYNLSAFMKSFLKLKHVIFRILMYNSYLNEFTKHRVKYLHRFLVHNWPFERAIFQEASSQKPLQASVSSASSPFTKRPLSTLDLLIHSL